MTEPVIITEPGLYPDIPEDQYHRDPVPERSLSVTSSKLLLPPSCPAIFDYRRKHPKPPSAAMGKGTVVHGMILGSGQPVGVIDAPDWRKKATQELRDEMTASGMVPMLAADYAECEAIAQAVRDHDLAGGLFAEGDAEQSIFWRDEAYKIWLRMRMDWATWFDGLPSVVDFKTTADASPEGFAKSCAEYGYYRQDPWYREGWATVLDCDPDEIDFIFVSVQTVEPYLVMTYRLLPEHVELGREMNAIAREIYRDCTKANTWPAWSESIEDLPLPGWAVRDIERGINEWHS
ncbi:MAG TPA: PD-(D/E)XK nuclease-like domain-containing protein [Streptosporangiaceae bacterium]|nr:PD-(D/E)XK nuclease-like domain-containing protein [Streptosporangiaceae bacterium]